MDEIEEQILRQAAVASRGLDHKAEVFGSSLMWTPEFIRRAKLWMTNFKPEEQRLAGDLLDGFLYFSDRHANQLMLAGFQALSSARLANRSGQAARAEWTAFCDSYLLTYVESEQQNATDSGPECARKFRIAADVPKSRTLSPYSTLNALIHGRANEVVFVDDFVGTGSQFITSWSKQRNYTHGEEVVSLSFAGLFEQLSDVRAYFCPSVSTAYGLREIQRACPQVVVSPGAVLDDRHSVLHPNSLVWPQASRAEGQAFVRTVSHRLGLPETDGKESDWRGFHELALAVAIRDTIPDSTLRLFRHTEGGWKPLVKRS